MTRSEGRPNESVERTGRARGCDGGLDFALRQGLREVEVAAIMRQVLEGLAHLHSRGILHRDVKVLHGGLLL